MPAQPPMTSASPITWKPYLRKDETARQRDAHNTSDCDASQATCCLHRSSALQGLLLRRETQSASTKAKETRQNENRVGNGRNLFQRPVRPLIRIGSTCKDGSMLLQTAGGKATGKHTTTARRHNRRNPPPRPASGTAARYFGCSETMSSDGPPVARGKMRIPGSIPRHF
jgi:hypothetical protein